MTELTRKEIEKEVGRQLRSLRNAKGYSLQYAAEMLGLSTNHYADIERGKYFPRIDTLVSIVDFYNCTMDDLFKNVIQNGYVKDASECMSRISKLSPDKRKRIVDVIMLLTEE